ncbi:MAG: response regulator [Candidatus Omnitrophica bacterium]|nr:response regulator [Candidatus Omnitrophota bacterium]
MADNVLSFISLNIYALPLLPVAVLIFLTGFYIYLQNRKSIVNLSFFLLCVAILFWLFGLFGVYSVKNPELALVIYRRVAFLGVVLISPLVYFFSEVWLELGAVRKKIIGAGFAGAAFFYFLGLFSDRSFPGMQKYFWGYYPIYGVYNQVFLVFFFGYFLAAFYNFIRAYRSQTHKIPQAQIKLISIAFLVSFLSSLDYLPKIIRFELYPLGFLYVFFWIAVVAYSIIKYKTMDIETAVHKTLMWFMTAVIAVLPFAWLIYGTQRWTATLPGFFSTAYSLSLLLAFYFYFKVLQPYLDYFFQRQSANLKNTLSEFSQELVYLKDLRSLLQRLPRLLRKSLYVRKVSIYLRDEASGQFVPAIAKGIRGLQPIPADHPVVRWAELRNEVIVADLADGDPEIQAFKHEFLAYFLGKEAQVAVPLIIGGKMIGMIHLGKKENLKRYAPVDIQFLKELQFPVAIAFSNSIQFENVNKLYEQVQVQNDRLKELDRLKTEFLANTSHELRTPLNGILGLVESVIDGADGPVNESQKKHLEMIIESGANLKELINNLLELSRMESGQMELKVKAFNIMNVIDAVRALLGGVAQKKGLRFEKIAPPQLSDVYGDPEKIQRVLINLAGNSIKFTHEGSVTIKVEEDEARLKISVADTGIGISPEDQKIVFERFRQADGSATRTYEGTGLGLSIAREIAQLHGSSIEVQSTPQKGSAFSFFLPKHPEGIPADNSRLLRSARNDAIASHNSSDGSVLRRTRSPEDDEAISSNTSVQIQSHLPLEKDPEFQEAVRGHGEKILIVDDNAINREVVKTRLQMHQYEVIEAVDGIDALEKMKLGEPDLVILDLMMPRMSGYEFCRKVRASRSSDQLPVIMLTAKTDMGDKIHGLSLGANDYISKPFNKDELIARVGILIKIRKMTRELKRWNEELEQIVDTRTKELAKTQDQLIQAEKLATIGTLAGGVAHEINNPLTAVLTNAQILKMSPCSEDDLETLSLIEEGAKRCQVIIQKLLKYARQPGEEQGLTEVDLGQVVRSTVSMLQYQLAQDDIQVQISSEGTYPIHGISNELEQVFTNLILNARDAVKSAKRAGQIQIILRRKNHEVEADVMDNGIGIKKENLTRIFDPFFTTKDVGSGTGLGLAVSHSILQKHQAKVEVRSEEGMGSVFTLRFTLSENVLIL